MTGRVWRHGTVGANRGPLRSCRPQGGERRKRQEVVPERIVLLGRVQHRVDPVGISLNVNTDLGERER